VARLIEEGDTSVVTCLSEVEIAFNGNFHNVNDLKQALESIDCTPEEREPVLDLFEKAFNHHAFTGRSGTFFGYEGLGSIYWHMVSKLVLAVQENLCDFKHSCTPGQADELLGLYREFRDGLGVTKNPSVYGAFPTDAYSHTPAHAGAQQPGMTGQVKEDILIRLRELGLVVDSGRIVVKPDMLEKDEFLREETTFNLFAIDGSPFSVGLQPGSLAFTFCQVPVVYHSEAGKDHIRLTHKDGSETVVDGLALNAESSREIFMRTGNVCRLDVGLASITA
jgi:hypothetical protein